MNQHFEEPHSEGNVDSNGRGQYEPSIISSVASSQLSVFSDAPSNQSSIASSVSDDFRHVQDDLRDRSALRAYHQQQQQAKALVERTQYECMLRARQAVVPSYAEVTSVPQEQRQHPRRSSLVRNTRPPSLVRQSERKVNFVDNLVDSATQMVEVIWPLSVVPCSNGDATAGKGVLPLRTYIEETLRRSRTSYSTLQVALYYLILIKPFVPSRDFTMEQRLDCAADRALMCGRRMFLAALILASKYLQDRNYSAKAWSKMSGLKVNEINMNEKTFLSKVNWKLHIPEILFKRWTEVVLRFTPNMQPPSPTKSLLLPSLSWKCIVPLLTPELDTVPLFDGHVYHGATPTGFSETSSPNTPLVHENFANANYSDSSSTEATPVPAPILPRFLEPKTDLIPPTPALARMGPLPTPIMTPASVASSTPAVSACSSRRSSMTSAMAFANRIGLSRCSLDQHPAQHPSTFPVFSRRPSYDISNNSSPESMLTDRSTSSRTSSISSISTVSSCSSVAPARACLARQATCRNAGLPLTIKEEMRSSTVHPHLVSEDMDLTSSPEMIDFRISDKALLTPHRHSKYSIPAVNQASTSCEKSRKRCRPRGGRRSNLQEEVRMLLEEELDTMMDLDDAEEADSSPSPVQSTKTSHPYRISESSSDYPRSRTMMPVNCSNDRVLGERHEGNKRRCYASTAMHMSVSPALYGEVA